MIIDPPRAGMHKDVLAQVLSIVPEKIIYVSCNPAILARDLQKLCEHDYITDCVQLVDMFPQTGHIEAVAVLKKRS